MRPIFAIYLVAGITLFVAILNSVAYTGQAYAAHHAIVILKPEGDDLAKIQDAQSQDLDTAAEGFALALLQAVIIVSARKVQKQIARLDTALEPTTTAPSAFAALRCDK